MLGCMETLCEDRRDLKGEKENDVFSLDDTDAVCQSAHDFEINGNQSVNLHGRPWNKRGINHRYRT